MTRRNACAFTIVCLCYWACVSRVSAGGAATTEDKTLESLRQLYGSRDPPILKVNNRTFWWPELDPKLEPKAKDLRTKKLEKKLGRDFDREWMSVDEPDEQLAQLSTAVPESLRQQAAGLDFSYVNDEGETVTMDEQTVEQMQAWLARKAACPVQYRWTFVGKLFWPRWIKDGQCADQNCSWPEGMACEPGKISELQLLFWHCRGSKGKSKQGPPDITPSREKRGTKDGEKKGSKKKRKKKCDWIKVPYPVTSECTCKCKEKK